MGGNRSDRPGGKLTDSASARAVPFPDRPASSNVGQNLRPLNARAGLGLACPRQNDPESFESKCEPRANKQSRLAVPKESRPLPAVE